MNRLAFERCTESGRLSNSKQLTLRRGTRGHLAGGEARSGAREKRATTNCTCSRDSCTDSDFWRFVVVVVFILLFLSERSVREAKASGGRRRRGSRSFFSRTELALLGEEGGAEDRQECPRRRDPLSTDRSLIKPYGRYLRGTRTSLRSAPARMDLCGKYAFVYVLVYLLHN